MHNCEHTKDTNSLTLKWANFIVCELYLTKVGFSKNENKTKTKKNLSSGYLRGEAKDLRVDFYFTPLENV